MITPHFLPTPSQLIRAKERSAITGEDIKTDLATLIHTQNKSNSELK